MRGQRLSCTSCDPLCISADGGIASARWEGHSPSALHLLALTLKKKKKKKYIFQQHSWKSYPLPGGVLSSPAVIQISVPISQQPQNMNTEWMHWTNPVEALHDVPQPLRKGTETSSSHSKAPKSSSPGQAHNNLLPLVWGQRTHSLSEVLGQKTTMTPEGPRVTAGLSLADSELQVTSKKPLLTTAPALTSPVALCCSSC